MKFDHHHHHHSPAFTHHQPIDRPTVTVRKICIESALPTDTQLRITITDQDYDHHHHHNHNHRSLSPPQSTITITDHHHHHQHLPASTHHQLLQKCLRICHSRAQHAADATGLPAIADDSGLSVDALDGAYDITKAGAFKYWRSFSADFPGREDRDQGASYSAAKPK